MTKYRQVGAIATRRAAAGAVEVLLVTSRGSRRWVIPKGWPWRNTSDAEAAAGEAWEEAGVRGAIRADPIGTYTYRKRWSGAGFRPLAVSVYLLEVSEEASVWPEVAERTRGWFSPTVAAGLVAEEELKQLLLALAQSP